MSYINRTELVPNKRLYYKVKTTIGKDGKESTKYDSDPFTRELGARYTNYISKYNRNNKRALGALKSIISKDNNDRFKDQTSAKDLYNSINSTFS
jgi:hypothetical protein